MGYLATSQIQHLHKLGGKRNAQRIIKGMEYYLNHMKLDEHVYFLNKEGRDLIGSKKERRKTQTIDHFLLRNQYLIHFKIDQVIFEPNNLKWDEYIVIPDAWYKRQGREYFLEIDRQQLMINNREKINLYQSLKKSGKLKEFPTVVFVTLTEYRQKQLRVLLNEEKLKSEVYLKVDII
jgi:hypothetical protein